MVTTPATKSNIVYSDFQTNLTSHPIKKDITLLTNEEAVKRSIKNIILTNYYERPFRPKFGTNLRKYLFDNIDSIILKHIESDISSAIENYEPRVDIIDIKVSNAMDTNEIDVTITFTVINSLQVVSFNTIIALDRVR